MEDQGRVAVVEDAVVDERDLAAAALLGGASHHADLPFDTALPQRLQQGDPRCSGCCADEVVSAGVAEAAECVVLAHEGHPGTAIAAAGVGDEGGGHAGHIAAHLESLRLEQSAEGRAGAGLLEPCLGVGVDVEGNVAQLGALLGEDRLDAGGDRIGGDGHVNTS